MKLYQKATLAITIILGFSLGGCASLTSLDVVQDKISLDERCANFIAVEKGNEKIVVADEKGKISSGYINALISGDAPIDPLLDCALSPVTSEEAKLYRGHVLISLLASYGAYNLALGPYEERVGDAITLLAHIKQAEKSLRGASRAVKPDIPIREFQGSPARLDRITYILEVALYAERPTLRRIKGEIRSLVGAVAAGSPAGTLKLGIEGAVTGIRKSIHLRHYGRAYLADAQEDLARFKENALPTEADWNRRDEMINEACHTIMGMAKIDTFSCIPE
jgi:hypothetical protein